MTQFARKHDNAYNKPSKWRAYCTFLHYLWVVVKAMKSELKPIRKAVVQKEEAPEKEERPRIRVRRTGSIYVNADELLRTKRARKELDKWRGKIRIKKS